MKRILFLIHALNPGGAQKVLVRLVNEMDKSKYSITIVTIYKRHELKSELDSSIKLRSIICSSNPIVERIYGLLLRHVFPSKFVADKLVGNNYDYAVAFLEGEPTKYLSGSSLPKGHKIAWVHADLMKIFTSQGLYRTVEQHKNVYERYGKIICVSNDVKKSIEERFGLVKNVDVIHNIIDYSKLRLLSTIPSIDIRRNSGVNIVLVGNCRKEKAYDRFLRVCVRLRSLNLPFHITICGGGVEYDTLVKLKKSLGLDEFVDFLGEVGNPYPLMKQSDLLVCASLSEGFSTVVIESMILGCPVLTTDCSGMREILDDGKYGIIVENSEEGLFVGLTEVIKNPLLLNDYKGLLKERIPFFSKESSLSKIDELFQ